nr:MAG TPA: putative tail component [Caudoviricetes sp.]
MSVKIEGLNEFTKEMLDICSKEYPKQVKRMLQKSGNKLRRKVVGKAKGMVKTKTGNYIKGFKRGRVYKYGGDEDAVRVYNSAPHAHLIEYGHRMVTKSGKEVGFVKGYHVLDGIKGEFSEEFSKDIDEMLDNLKVE